MAYLTKEKVKEIINNAPAGTTPEGVVAALRANGHTLEGYQDDKSAKKAALSKSIKERRLNCNS